MISVVIPTLNEASTLPAVLATLAGEAVAHEVIVADGASADGTATLARRFGATVVTSNRGRGPQLRTGAEIARGDVFLFLHADSGFPAGGLARIEETLGGSPDVVGGNFRVVFDGGDRFSRWLTRAYAWSRRHGRYYGDSGVFVRREVYRSLGGIKAIALMEDYDFVRRLERAGRTCCIEQPPLITSARRFRNRRPGAIFWGWIKIHLLYFVRVSPDRLADLYDSERRRGHADPS